MSYGLKKLRSLHRTGGKCAGVKPVDVIPIHSPLNNWSPNGNSEINKQ